MSELRLAEVGVRHALLVEQRESRNRVPPQMGFAQVNYGNLFVRDRWTLFAIARELGCSVDEILEPDPEKKSGPRWSEIAQASESVLEDVRALPAQIRDLVILRGSGISWRRIQHRYEGRLSFSLREDHSRGMSSLLRTCYDHLNFLASFDNYFVVKTFRAA